MAPEANSTIDLEEVGLHDTTFEELVEAIRVKRTEVLQHEENIALPQDIDGLINYDRIEEPVVSQPMQPLQPPQPPAHVWGGQVPVLVENQEPPHVPFPTMPMEQPRMAVPPRPFFSSPPPRLPMGPMTPPNTPPTYPSPRPTLIPSYAGMGVRGSPALYQMPINRSYHHTAAKNVKSGKYCTCWFPPFLQLRPLCFVFYPLGMLLGS